MKRSELVARVQELIYGPFNGEVATSDLLVSLVEEAGMMPPCGRNGKYDWDPEDSESAYQSTITQNIGKWADVKERVNASNRDEDKNG